MESRVKRSLIVTFTAVFMLFCLTFALVACKGDEEFTGLKFDDKSFVYDGTPYSLSVENLPDGAVVTYEGNNTTDAGVYTVKATVKKEGFVDKELTATLTIEKAESVITADDVQTVEYDGEPVTVSASLNHSGASLTYEPASGFTEYGEYEVKIKAAESANYKAAEKTVKLRVLPKSGESEFENLVFSDAYFKYDGQEKSIEVQNLPEGAFVIYENASAADKGEYIAKAIVAKEGYKAVELTAKLTIGDANYTFENLEFKDAVLQYNGQPQSIYVSNLPEGATVEYSGNGKVNLGTYTVTATVKKENYDTVTLSAKLTIMKGMIKNVTFEDGNFVYDGTEKSIYASSYPDGATVKYTGNKQINAGKYLVKVEIEAYGYVKYTDTAMMYINKAETVITAEDNQEFDCDGLYHEVEATINHDETVLSRLVEIAAPGTHSYTLTTPETTNYNAGSLTRNIIIKNNFVPAEEYVSEDGSRVNTIEITDNSNAEKVVSSGFEIPETLTEDDSRFTLPKLISDRMLLQANVAVRIWGSVSEGDSIAVRITNADMNSDEVYYLDVKEGSFIGYVGAMPYGLGYEIELITSTGKYTKIADVAYGELYIAGGQSNMGWAMNQCYKDKVGQLLYSDIISSSSNKSIRLCSIMSWISDTPIDEPANINGWNYASSSSVSNFSAVAYFFAREMYDLYKVPVGVIVSCMGGTSVYTWMPRDVYEDQVAKGLVVNRKNGAPEPTDPIAAGSKYFNAMIYSIKNVVARGVIWYQGEGQSDCYAENLVAMIQGWRDTFDRQNLLFATVGMPRMTYSEGDYFYSREAHKKACTMIDNLVYSSNVDCGLLSENVAEGDTLNGWGTPVPDGIHPYDKEPVGTRLADTFAKAYYGAIGTWTSPVIRDVTVQGDRVVIRFDNVGSGLMLQGLAGFEIANYGKTYTAATPELICEDIIVLRAEGVDSPAKLRYGYSNKSVLQDAPLTDFSQSVCVYNTKNGEKAYPLDSFEMSLVD